MRFLASSCRLARWRAALVLGGAILALAGAGCSKTKVSPVYETTCGDGGLYLTRRVTTHAPAPNEVKLWIEFERSGRRRTVDIVKPRETLYAAPTEAEKYHRLRTGDDDWPVFISPREFTSAEYELIRARLQAVLGEIDAALVSEPPGEALDFGNVARLSSTRYTDYDGFRRTYASDRPDVRLELFPNGEVWCLHPQGQTLVGSVVANGRKVLLPPGHGLLEKAGIPDPVDFALRCRRATGATLAADFTVERITNREYELALKQERLDRRKR